MTTFEQRITDDLKAAMKAKDKERMRTIRAIKSGILLANTDGSGEAFSDEKAIKLVQKMVKQRKDSLAVFTAQGRADLAEVEQAELNVLEDYLPKQLTTEELESAVKIIIEKVGATSMKDMGKVMGMASKQFGGSAEGKAISAAVKKMLQ